MCNSWFVACPSYLELVVDELLNSWPSYPELVVDELLNSWPSYPELVVDELLNSRNKHTRLPTWLQRGLTRIPRGQATEASHRAPTMHRNKISLEAEKTLPAKEQCLIPWISNRCYKHQPQFTA